MIHIVIRKIKHNLGSHVEGDIFKEKKVHFIIFSKNRPFQLNSLLHSIYKNFDSNFYLTIYYKASTQQMDRNYKQLKIKWKFCDWVEESEKEGFKNKLESIIRTDIRHTGFFVDDNLIFNKIKLLDFIDFIKHEEIGSLRLGLNTKYSYMRSKSVKYPKNLVFVSNGKEGLERNYYLNWKIKKTSMAWNYVRALDGSIFKTEFLLKILPKKDYSSPSQLEFRLNRNLYSDYNRSAFSPIVSCVVNIPLNRVQDEVNNQSMQLSEAYLNNLFEQELILDLGEINPWSIFSSHMEIDIDRYLKKW